MVPVEHYLYLGGALFTIGVLIVLFKKNVIMLLMGIELMLNAANINFVAFSRYDPVFLQGQVFVIFVMVIAAAETAVGLAIILKLFYQYGSLNLDDYNKLKD